MQVSGLAAVALGALLLCDAPRVLMSRLILAAGVSGANSALVPPQPLLYYVALASMGLGLVICAVAVLGCWASCLHSYCILGTVRRTNAPCAICSPKTHHEVARTFQ